MHRKVGRAVVLACALLVAGCTAEVGGDATGDRQVRPFSTNGVTGEGLQQRVLARAAGIAPQNRPYVYNGVQDCYGYVRQVWNAILHDGSAHEEDFYPQSYNRSRWHAVGDGLPVGDAPSAEWVYFSSASELLPGDALATAQGHAWGAYWHGGIYAGMSGGVHYQWDSTIDSVGSGAFKRRLWSGFRYYYRPTHDLLAAEPEPQPPPGMTSRLHGRVSAGGAWAAQVTVSAWGHEAGDLHTTTTGDDGIYVIERLDGGSLYNVVVNAAYEEGIGFEVIDAAHAYEVRDNVELVSGPDGWHGENFELEH